jgi:tetratricopeptide (TPR) repeat protein
MGNEEAGDPRPTRLDRLEKVLESSAADGFAWKVLRFPDETHNSVVLRSHYWGLREIFAGWQLPRGPEGRAFSGTVADIKAHFRALSERFGCALTPPENTVNLAGYQLLGAGRHEAAIAVFRYNVELYPESANVHDSLGEALEQSGQMVEALECYSKAVKQAVTVGDDRLGIFEANRDRARQAVEGSEEARE